MSSNEAMGFLPRFRQSQTKIDRAERHLHEVVTCLGQYLRSDFARAYIEEGADGDRIMIQAHHPLPTQISVSLGDAIHNLRAALDYVTSKVVSDARQLDRRTTFPMHETRNELVTSFSPPEPNAPACPTCGRGAKKAGANYPIKRVAPDLADLIINHVKPYDTGDGACPEGRAVWALGKLDNINKHRMIIPTVQITEVHNICAEDECGSRYIGLRADVTGNQAIPVVETDGRLHITHYGPFSAKVLFPKPIPIFGEKPIVEVMQQLCYLTRGVVSALEAHFKRGKV